MSETTANNNKPPGAYLEYTDHGDIFTTHRFPETIVDLGEIRMNYAVAGSSDKPALLLVPGQTLSWWSYETVMGHLSSSYQVYAVDLRGQGRSTWTPGRYSLNIFGNDLVRFIDRVIGRPVVVCGLSSGGLIAAWLAAYALPGQIIGAVLEDPPIFSSQLSPPVGQSAKQGFAFPLFSAWTKWLGPQWSIGNEDGFKANIGREMPWWFADAVAGASKEGAQTIGAGLPPRYYDPGWASAFEAGKMNVNCDHEAMLKQVKVPVLFTHHLRYTDPVSGNLVGAISDVQVAHVKRLVEGTGNSFTLLSFPRHAHSMHGTDPGTYVTTITKWMAEKGLGPEVKVSTDGAGQVSRAPERTLS
ncbi:hydrolase [Sarocladium strictum]